ncbi:HAD family hydrolase [bacterium]|nr:HAD family hydrolase [bacterium]
MIYGVIFDLDGTLLNTLEDLCDSTNYALAQFGFPKRSIDEVRNFVGNGVKLLIERAIPDGSDNPEFEECLNVFKEHYKNNMYNKTKPYNGVMEMLRELKFKGIQVAVVSNKFDTAVKELCKKYFGDFIHIAIGENEAAGVRKKPAPDSVFKAITEMKVRIENVVYAGDSETDVQTAKNAEIDCIGCAWGFRDKSILLREGATHIIESPVQILDVITKL